MKKTKCTPELIERMKENVKAGFTYSALSLSLGISEDTFYSWIRKGRDENLQPYCTFYAALKESESELLRECLESVKLSMRMGNVDSAKWILEHRYAKDGYGKQVNVKAQQENLNINLNAQVTEDDKTKIRNEILAKLRPKSNLLGQLTEISD